MPVRSGGRVRGGRERQAPRSAWEERARAPRSGLSRLWPFLLPAVLVHVVVGAVGDAMVPLFAQTHHRSAPLRLVIVQPQEEEDALQPPDEEDPEPDGQIVELPEPKDEQEPDEADYLAEHDHTVPEESRTELFEVNPEVLSNQWSEEQKLEQEDLVDLDVDKPSTGAQVGNDRFDPARDGDLSSLPSPWAVTNREGLQAPVPSAHEASDVRGAPQNDLLDEKEGEEVALNAKEYLYASYLNRIRRLVNFYWKQNVDNLPPGVRLVKSSYMTGVEVILDGYGALELVEVTLESSSPELDGAVVQAFRVAGPFPNPPEGLIEPDGRIYLPDMTFTVRLGQASLRYDGVDPRAGVQFPGLLKSPR
ncbi:MAG: TonB C-terminal domain-containing protein [Alphaproteobacteria bacterium]|nr:TonB C-terminal domain-containing protein [Alphaproteobacteria bacterium]